jgi:hypothetical protein
LHASHFEVGSKELPVCHDRDLLSHRWDRPVRGQHLWGEMRPRPAAGLLTCVGTRNLQWRSPSMSIISTTGPPGPGVAEIQFFRLFSYHYRLRVEPAGGGLGVRSTQRGGCHDALFNIIGSSGRVAFADRRLLIIGARIGGCARRDRLERSPPGRLDIVQ